MLAVLDASDYLIIALIVILVVGAGRTASSLFKPSDAARLRRLEAKLDLILSELGLAYQEPAVFGTLSDEVRALADDPAKKIQAIKLYREQTGAGLKEAKDAVEAYLAGRG